MLEARLKLGQSAFPEQAPAGPTLEEYYKKFEKNYFKAAVRPTTRESYETNFRLSYPSGAWKRLGGSRYAGWIGFSAFITDHETVSLYDIGHLRIESPRLFQLTFKILQSVSFIWLKIEFVAVVSIRAIEKQYSSFDSVGFLRKGINFFDRCNGYLQIIVAWNTFKFGDILVDTAGNPFCFLNILEDFFHSRIENEPAIQVWVQVTQINHGVLLWLFH
jgi:hypothetical protein